MSVYITHQNLFHHGSPFGCGCCHGIQWPIDASKVSVGAAYDYFEGARAWVFATNDNLVLIVQ